MPAHRLRAFDVRRKAADSRELDSSDSSPPRNNRIRIVGLEMDLT